MKQTLLVATLLLCALGAQAQKVFSTKYDYQADVKVFVADHDYQADLLVYRVTYDYQAGKNDGKWFFTKYDYQSDVKIYFTDYDYQAGLIIYFVKYDYQAGWRNKSKQQLMYGALPYDFTPFLAQKQNQ